MKGLLTFPDGWMRPNIPKPGDKPKPIHLGTFYSSDYDRVLIKLDAPDVDESAYLFAALCGELEGECLI